MLTQDPAAEAEAGDASLPGWARPASPPDGPGADTPPGRGSVVRGVAVRVVGAGGVALVLFLLGHQLGAAILLTVLTASSVLSLTVPAVGRGIDRFIAGFQGLVGRALSFVLLGLVHLLVFVPISFVLRLLRHDPLALGAGADDPTFWRGAARRPGKPLYKRPFAYERHPLVAGRRRRVGLLQVLGVLVAIGLVDLGVGRLAGVADAPATAGDEAAEPELTEIDSPAAQDEPWASQLFYELDVNYKGMRYHPFRSLQMGDSSGEYVNVTDGVRRSYEPQLTGAAGEPIEVYFFGGSAMMGWYQRDEHTIASEFARLAEADGIDVEVVNRGTPAYDNWQEHLLLDELVTAGETPELAVFYDGMNEIGAQFRSPGGADDPTHIHASDVEATIAAAETDGQETDGAAEDSDDDSPLSQMVDAYSEQSALAEVVRRVRGTDGAPTRSSGAGGDDAPTSIFVPWAAQNDQPAESGRIAADLHGRGIEAVEALAAHYDFRTAFFWQPSVFTRPEVSGEETARGSWGTDPGAWTTAIGTARENLHDSVVDLSDTLDGVDEPVMYDYVHTNELGAQVVAQAIYDQLKPTLLEIQGERE